MPSAMKLMSAFSLNSITYATSRMTRAFGSAR